MPRRFAVPFLLCLLIVAVSASAGMAACPELSELAPVPVEHDANELAIGDLDNDGEIDLVTVSTSAGSINVRLGNGNGTFGSVLSYVAPSPEEVSLGDVNNDGFADIVVSSEPLMNQECISFGSCAGYSVLLNDGDGTFGTATTTPVPSVATVAAIRIADFNDDGNQDALVAGTPMSTPDPSLHVLFGDGTGAFPSRRSWAIGGQVRDAIAAKLNPGSTQPDVIVAVSPQFASDFLRVIVFPSQSGTFPGSSASRNIAQSSSEVHLTTADFDDNGNLDIGLSFEHSGGMWGAAVVRANGNSSLTEPGFYVETSGGLTGIAALDLDGDGDNDIVTPFGSMWKGFLRQGSDFLESPVRYGPFLDTAAHAHRVVTTDVDRDGRSDLLFLDVAHDAVFVLRNTCSSRHSTVVVSSSPNPSTFNNSITFNVQVQRKADASMPTGTVTLFEGETILGSETLNASGFAFIDVANLAIGDHPVTAQYHGDSDFGSRTSVVYQHTVARPPFGPPLNVTATGNGAANQITIAWIPTTDSTSHDILRRLNGTSSIIAANVVGEEFIDSSVNNTSAYVYTVRSHGTGGETTAASNGDIATTATLVLPGDKRIRATDFTTTRSLINSLRTAAGLSAFTFTDANLSGNKVKAVHLTELRTALDQARTALGFAALTFTNPTLAPGTSGVRAIDIQEIRNSLQ